MESGPARASLFDMILERAAEVLGLGPLSLALIALGAAVALGVLLYALRRRCSRCGTWFAAAPVEVAQSGYRHGRTQPRVTYRCGACGAEWSRAESRPWPYP